MIPVHPESWPLLHEGADAFAGDEWLYDPGDHANHLRFQGDLPQDEHERADRAWFELYVATLRGEEPWSSPERLRLEQVLALPQGIIHDKRRPVVAPLELRDEHIADLVEDFVPDCGMSARDRFFGPFADQPLDPRLMVAAAASICWLPLLDGEGTVSLRIRNRKPKLDLDFRRSIGAVGLAPPMLWDLDGQPMLPMGERWRPTDLRLPQDGPSLGGPPRAWLGRAVPGPQGWWLACAVGLSEPPPLPALMRRLLLEAQRQRRHERRATWETTLRARVEVLYRTCASWIWLKEVQ